MNETAKRMTFNKGYFEEGFVKKVYHLDLRYAGDNDELCFKHYILEFSKVAKEYKQLKLNLWNRNEHNRDEYTETKTEFINRNSILENERYKGWIASIKDYVC